MIVGGESLQKKDEGGWTPLNKTKRKKQGPLGNKWMTKDKRKYNEQKKNKGKEKPREQSTRQLAHIKASKRIP